MYFSHDCLAMLASLLLVLAFCVYCSSKLLQYMLELQPHVVVAAAAKYVGATATMWVQHKCFWVRNLGVKKWAENDDSALISVVY